MAQAAEPTRESAIQGLSEVLQTLQAQNLAFRISLFGLLRAVNDDGREKIREVLDFALKLPASEDDPPAYREALDKSLRDVMESLESSPGGSADDE